MNRTQPHPWPRLAEPDQLALAEAALRRAAQTIAGQAEALASEMESGHLADRGGANALRLLAAVVRGQPRGEPAPAGHA